MTSAVLLWTTWVGAAPSTSFFGGDEFDIFNCVIDDGAGGHYLVGGLGRSEARSVGWIVRIDRDGSRVLDRSVEPRPNSVSALLDALVLPNGDVIAVGRTRLPGQTKDDGWVARFSANGTEIWNRFYDFGEQERFYFVAQALDGLILTGGRIETASAAEGGSSDGLLVWIDAATGDVQKTVREGTEMQRAAFYDGALLEDGGLALVGWATDPALKTDDVWVVRLTADHRRQWSKRWGGAGQDVGRSLVVDSDGFVVFGWGTQSGADHTNGLVLRLDITGSEEWSHFHEVGSVGDDRFYHGAADGGMGYIAAGNVAGAPGAGVDKQVDRGWVVRLDSDGQILEQSIPTVPRSGRLYGVLAKGGDVLAAGYGVPTGSNHADAWLTALAWHGTTGTSTSSTIESSARFNSSSGMEQQGQNGKRLKTCYTHDGKVKNNRDEVSIDLKLPGDGKARTGDPVQLRWQFRKDRQSTCSTPLYLVLSMPERVRFRGEKFIALPPGTDGPFDLKYQHRRARVFIPLHVGDTVWSGEMDIEIFQAGSFTLDWALVEIPKYRLDSSERNDFASGKWVVVPGSTGSRSFGVLPGSPAVVIQDQYSTDTPDEIIHSNSGEFVLEVYEGRYRVLEKKTGNLIVERDGVLPNFSPTSRFIGAYRDGFYKFDVVDLYSGRLVYTVSGGATGVDYANLITEVAWGSGDAFLAASFAGWGGVAIRQPLIDAWAFTAAGSQGGLSSHPAPGWRHTLVRLDIENAVLHIDDSARLESGDRNGKLTSLLQTPIVGEVRQRREKSTVVRTQLLIVDRQLFPVADGNKWNLAGPVQLSHVGRQLEMFKESGTLSPLYVFHSRTQASVNPAEYTTATTLIRGRGIVGNGRGVVIPPYSEEIDGTPANSDRVRPLARRLEDFGLHLAPLVQTHRMLPPTEPQRGGHIVENREAYNEVHRAYREALEDWKKVLVQRLVDSVPEAAAQITPADEMGATCPFPGPRGVHYWTLTGAWRWEVHDDGLPVWLLQSHCVRGATGAVGGGQLALFAPGVSGEYVHWLFSQGTSDEPTSSEGTLASFDESLGLNEGQASKAVLSHERFLIHVGSNETLLVYDLKTHRAKAFFQRVPNGDLISAIRLTRDARHLVQLNSDGRFYIYDLVRQKRVLNGYYLDDEVVLFTEQGYYWATSEGAHFVFLRFPGIAGYHSFHQFQKALDRPDIIRAVLAKGRSDHVAPVINVPPTVQLLVNASSRSDSVRGDGPVREIPVKLNATAADRLAAVRLYRDGVLATEFTVDTPEAAVETVLPVPTETRWLTAVAVDIHGVESAPQTVTLPVLERQIPSGRLFAVIVGTDTYVHLSRLGFARSDARAFAAALQATEGIYYSGVETELLLDEPDLNHALRARLEAIKRKANKNDTVMIYVAGHGLKDQQGRFYLAGQETDPARPRMTAVRWGELATSLNASTGRAIVFLDACHSGAAGEIATNDDAVRSFLTDNNAVTIISASKGRQFSQERTEIGGGVFTMSLSKLILNARGQTDTNHNGVLELSEVFKSLKGRVARMTAGDQTPWIARNRMVGEIPLF